MTMLDSKITYLDIIQNVNDFDSSKKQIGELVTSIIPLYHSGLHLLDGSLIEKSGVYSDFVDYIKSVYNKQTTVLNVIKHGNITENNGVLSGFSGPNFATIPVKLNTNSSWEFVTKIHTPNAFTKFNDIAGIPNKIAIGINTNTKFNLAINIVNGSWEVVNEGTYIVLTDTDYWVKVTFTGTQYILSYSLDGTNYVTDITLSTTSKTSGIMNLGKYTSSKVDPISCIEGSIDLNECYINIAGERFWSGTTKQGFATELEWQEYITDYNTCGKFVYDSVNNTVRLPKITGFIQGASNLNEVGNIVEAGLPNITGEINIGGNAPNVLGAFYKNGNQEGEKGGDGGVDAHVYFDASRSSSIYGNSNTVQPQALQVLYYIVLINGSTEVLDYNINNLTTKHTACNAVMPDNSTYDELVLGASMSTYTAPADGYYWFGVGFPSTSDYFNVWVHGKEQGYGVTLHETRSGYNQMDLIPIKKGEFIQLYYNTSPLYYTFRFYYCVGNKDEKITS